VAGLDVHARRRSGPDSRLPQDANREQTTGKSIAGAADQSIIGEIAQWLSI
jgi:hypothetical protein